MSIWLEVTAIMNFTDRSGGSVAGARSQPLIPQDDALRLQLAMLARNESRSPGSSELLARIRSRVRHHNLWSIGAKGEQLTISEGPERT